MGKFVDDVIADNPVSLDRVILPSLQGEGHTTKGVAALDVEIPSDQHALVLGVELDGGVKMASPIRLLALSPPAAVLLMRKLQEGIETYLGMSLPTKDQG